jgi:hypothetical protein
VNDKPALHSDGVTVEASKPPQDSQRERDPFDPEYPQARDLIGEKAA